MERLLLTMEACGVRDPCSRTGADVFIAVMGDNAKAAGLKLMHELRQEGRLCGNGRHWRRNIERSVQICGPDTRQKRPL